MDTFTSVYLHYHKVCLPRCKLALNVNRHYKIRNFLVQKTKFYLMANKLLCKIYKNHNAQTDL